MYFNKFVAFISVDGEILRDNKDGTVRLPFGTEYSINLKNLESRNAVVKIWIDGEDVLDGNKIVVAPNDTCKLDGFMKGRVAKNKFKFIEKTKRIEDYRGNKIDDSLIRVEFQYEKEKPIYRNLIYRTYYDWFPNWTYYPYPPTTINDEPYDYTFWSHSGGSFSEEGNIKGSSSSVRGSVSSNVPVSYTFSEESQNDDGITVPGKQINQQFGTAFVNELEDVTHVLLLKLSGYRKNKPISEPVTVKTNLICSICGERNKYNARYCNNCGTFLE